MVYRLFLPPGYETSSQEFPLVLYLHGAGDWGTDNIQQLKDAYNLVVKTQTDNFGSFLLAPQTPYQRGWYSQREMTVQILDHVVRNYRVDSRRIFLTGFSMGGFGTFDLPTFRPDYFAAAVPIAGGGNPSTATLLKDLPMWIFHAVGDPAVPVERSREMRDALIAAGGEPKYTEFPQYRHHINNEVYGMEDLYLWLFSHGVDQVTSTLTPDEIYDSYTASDDDSDSIFDDLGDSAFDAVYASTSFVGEVDTVGTNRIDRLVVKFALPQPAERLPTLANATLRFFLSDIIGTPAGPLSLLHSVTDAFFDLDPLASDYADPSYVDTQLDLVQPTDELERFYELDVTDMVLADYAADGAYPTSAFRLQINEAVFLEDDQAHFYILTMPGKAPGNGELIRFDDENHLELVLTFAPEPSTVIFAAISLFGLVGYRWRRGRAGNSVGQDDLAL